MFRVGCGHLIRKDDKNFIHKDDKVLKKRIDYWPPARNVWSDSKLVLDYIRNATKKFKISVANKIQLKTVRSINGGM